jgi:hypothetical protein
VCVLLDALWLQEPGAAKSAMVALAMSLAAAAADEADAERDNDGSAVTTPVSASPESPAFSSGGGSGGGGGGIHRPRASTTSPSHQHSKLWASSGCGRLGYEAVAAAEANRQAVPVVTAIEIDEGEVTRTEGTPSSSGQDALAADARLSDAVLGALAARSGLLSSVELHRSVAVELEQWTRLVLRLVCPLSISVR